jgi:HSF-type DNA-binding
MFVVKDPDLFASEIIPQYFDHNKFSSFARQLNFYGFRKMQSKPIRNADYDAGTAKHVTFFNENFKKGRTDLLKMIQRSTRGGGTANAQDSSKEMQLLREQVQNLEMQLSEVTHTMEERIRRLELDMAARMEQMMMSFQMQQSTQQQSQLQLQPATSIGSINTTSNASQRSHQIPTVPSIGNNAPPMWTPNGLMNHLRANSINSLSYAQQQQQLQPGNQAQQMPTMAMLNTDNNSMAPPTLPPHPKQKQLPPMSFPGNVMAPADRMSSLRGISTLSRGISALSRGDA